MVKKERINEAKWNESKQQWRLDVQANSQRKSFYSSTPGRKGKIEAERKADAWLDGGGSDDPRLDELWHQFLQEISKTTGSGNHRNMEQIGRLYLLPKLKLKRISSITLQNWQNCITAAYQNGLSKKTCQNIRGAITALYNYARKNRINMERPEFLTIPRDAPVGKRNILQPDQLRQLFEVDWIEKYGRKETCWLIHAWRFDVLTGLRRGELSGLEESDIDGDILHINRAVNAQSEITRGKNENANRFLALSPLMKKVLADQKAMLRQHGVISPYLFPDEQGNRINPDHIYKRWVPYRKQHGIQSSIHELRHTMISIVSVEVPDPLLKQMVGHGPGEITNQYRHVVNGDAEKAALMVDSVFQRILQKNEVR